MVRRKSQRTLCLLRRQRAIERVLRKSRRCQLSPYVEARSSRIHGRGVFATAPIKRDAEIIEYTGEKISKSEADRRQQTHGVYIFTLNSRVDVDGAVGGNGAHLINHGCAPNAEALIDENRIVICALRRIYPGDEITYDYGFDADDYEDHPCHCGSRECIGFIVARRHRRRLLARIRASG